MKAKRSRTQAEIIKSLLAHAEKVSAPEDALDELVHDFKSG